MDNGKGGRLTRKAVAYGLALLLIVEAAEHGLEKEQAQHGKQDEELEEDDYP